MPPSIHSLTPLLQVFDMPRAIAFYRDMLGFEVVATSSPSGDVTTGNFYWAMLRRGDATLMLNTAYEDYERPPQPDPARVASHGDTTLFFACASADEFYAHLQSQGWPALEPETTHYGMRRVYSRDADGFELCFQHPVG